MYAAGMRLLAAYFQGIGLLIEPGQYSTFPKKKENRLLLKTCQIMQKVCLNTFFS